MLPRIVLFLLILVFVVVPAVSHLVWRFSDETVIKTLIVDKTVLDNRMDEHVSYNWVMRHNRVKMSTRDDHRPGTDYYGFFPLGDGKFGIRDFNSFTTTQLDSLADDYDMMYVTDTYGVYREEWDAMYVEPDPNIRLWNPVTRTDMMYGGTNHRDVDMMLRFKERGKPLIAEFNMMAAPTTNEVRQRFEEQFDVQWSGWTGRYFESLSIDQDVELPQWLIDNYKAQRGRDWLFTKPGLVFVNNDGQIVILERDTHMISVAPYIHTPIDDQKRFGMDAKVRYPFWFDIVSHGDSNRTVSTYRLNPNDNGRTLLQQFGIPEEFPAVIEGLSDQHTFYYFAGDFADNPISMRMSSFWKVDWISRFFYTNELDDRRGFFWNFYRPMVTTILKETR
jgi:hypothetical protein